MQRPVVSGDQDQQLYNAKATLTNTGRKTIDALEITWQLHRMLPTWDEREYHAYPSIRDKYEEDQAIAPGEGATMRSNANTFYEKMKVRRAECIPLRAAFSDGTTWINPAFADLFKP